MNDILLYIDDIRNPKTDYNWVVLRSSAEAIEYVKKNGMVKYASLDHDLGGDDTVMIFLKWLIEYDMDHNGQIIPFNFIWNVHSANPVGTQNIDGLLKNYMLVKRETTNLFYL